MEPITTATIVRSFAGLIMSENLSPRRKQALVIGISIIFFLAAQVASGNYSTKELYQSLLEGCTAGLSAIGMYEFTKKSVDKGTIQDIG